MRDASGDRVRKEQFVNVGCQNDIFTFHVVFCSSLYDMGYIMYLLKMAC